MQKCPINNFGMKIDREFVNCKKLINIFIVKLKID